MGKNAHSTYKTFEIQTNYNMYIFWLHYLFGIYYRIIDIYSDFPDFDYQLQTKMYIKSE